MAGATADAAQGNQDSATKPTTPASKAPTTPKVQAIKTTRGTLSRSSNRLAVSTTVKEEPDSVGGRVYVRVPVIRTVGMYQLVDRLIRHRAGHPEIFQGMVFRLNLPVHVKKKKGKEGSQGLVTIPHVFKVHGVGQMVTSTGKCQLMVVIASIAAPVGTEWKGP